MVDEEPTGLATDLALADRLVPIHPRAEIFLRIVGVNHHQPVEADASVEFPERGIERRLRREGIAGREHVAGVEAHAHAACQAWHSVDPLEHRADFRERSPEARTLARGRLDEDAGGERLRSRQGGGDAVGRAGHGDVDGLISRGARMGHHPRDAERLGPLELRDEPRDRLAAECLIGRRGIDQIRIVRDHEPQARVEHRPAEGRRVGRIERCHVPAVDVAGEHLQALAARFHRPLHGLREAAGDRLVGAEHGVGRRSAGGRAASHGPLRPLFCCHCTLPF